MRKFKKIKIAPKYFSASIKLGYKPQNIILRNQLGELMTKEESVEELLKNHFGNLLNKTQPTKEMIYNIV